MRKNKALTYRSNKYRSKRTECAGVWYASKAEAARAMELDMLKKAGEIIEWIPQPVFRLGVPENKYVADFLVINSPQCSYCGAKHAHGCIGPMEHRKEPRAWVEEIKGVETAVFKKNKRLWQAYGRLPLVIRRNGVEVERIIPEGK